MNKKILTVITVIVLSLTLAVSWAFTAAAANRKGNGACTGVNCVTGQNYVDSDGDGVCDNRTAQRQTTCNVTQQAQSTTKQDTTEENTTQETLSTAETTTAPAATRPNRPNYVDNNGDGICDNAKNPQRPQDGTGRQNGFCRGANR